MPQNKSRVKPRTQGLERVVFFSDAVMAIAITLLILEVRLPEVAEAGDFGRQVLALWPKYLGYFVSFWVIALYWVAHHRCFLNIRAYDRRLIYLNFLFLLCIAFMPFPTGLLFSHPSWIASVVMYAATAAAMGLSLTLLWSYAARRRFLVPGLSGALRRDVRLNLLLPPLVFLLTIGIAFLNTTAAMYGWLLLVPLYVFRRRRGRLTRECTPRTPG